MQWNWKLESKYHLPFRKNISLGSSPFVPFVSFSFLCIILMRIQLYLDLPSLFTHKPITGTTTQTSHRQQTAALGSFERQRNHFSKEFELKLTRNSKIREAG